MSSNDSDDGLTLAIMTVRQLPPSESLRMRVSLLSRYGMCEPFLPEAPRISSEIAHLCIVSKRTRGQGIDAISKSKQRAVDVSSLAHAHALVGCDCGALGSSEID